MSFFDVLARWLGLSDPVPADPPPGGSASAATGFGAQPPASAAPVAYGPYAQLWQSVDRHLAQFMAHSVLPHRQFEPDDVFKLVRIQVTGTSAAAQGAIDRFLAEFRPDSRRKAVLAAVARNCPQGVSTEGFVDFNRDFDQADLDDSDPYDAQLAQSHQGGYQLTLYGEWELQRPPAPSVPAQAATSGGVTAQPVPLHLDIDDAHGRRELSVAALPFVIGRTAAPAGQAVSGKFVSRRHGLLERDEQARVWWRDTSVNGSSIDGAAVAPGERRQLHNGARLRLGGESADAAECPELVVRWPATTDDDAQTPLRASLPGGTAVDTVTPLRARLDGDGDGQPAASAVTPLSAALPGPLCLLAVKDAHGSRTVAVTRLPYVVGRGELADCRVPEDNAGVSREHLIIRAIDAAGAQIDNDAVGKWGTQVDGAEQPARFTLGWGLQVTLAGRFATAPAVTLLLLPASA